MTNDDAQTSAATLAQCSITGKMVPEDELVTIQGHRVCAEGKAILLERLKSGEALPGELEKPTALRRFGCIFVDGLIIGVPFAIITAIVASNGKSNLTAGLLALITTAVQTVYFGQLHGTRGQSVGKIAGKLKVVNLDGSPITLNAAYIRALAYTGPGFLNGVAILTGSPEFVKIAGIIIGAWGLIDLICALVDRTRQRSLHDRIAGTRVVQKE